MKVLFLLIVVLLIAGAFIAIKTKGLGKTGKAAKGRFVANTLVTANEQGMFWRLVETFPAPEHVVLTQVSFGALLVAKDGASRYSFAQKRADFVVTNKGFKVLAVIELDDASHKGREKEDESRDAMLVQAGYKVLRYAKTPDVEKLRTDMAPPIAKPAETKPPAIKPPALR